MRTVFIYDELDGTLQFFVCEGDYSHLDDTYIGDGEADELKQEELNRIIYSDSGEYLPTMLGKFPTEEVQNGAKVIVCGFLP